MNYIIRLCYYIIKNDLYEMTLVITLICVCHPYASFFVLPVIFTTQSYVFATYPAAHPVADTCNIVININLGSDLPQYPWSGWSQGFLCLLQQVFLILRQGFQLEQLILQLFYLLLGFGRFLFRYS